MVARVLVADASVTVKALLRVSDERDRGRAQDLFSAWGKGAISLLQPHHWLAEVAGVLARLEPVQAQSDVELLSIAKFQVADGAALYRRAIALAIELNHHVFDTLYHAAALECDGATLVTADDHYYRKASRFGGVVRLSDWRQ